MKSPPLAIAWQLWARFRWWLIAGTVYLLLIALACQALPLTSTFQTLRIFLLSPLMAAPLGLVAVFLFGIDADLVSRESNFPERMLTLPVRTRTLVGWPMLFGAATTLLAWVAIGQLILRTVRLELPLLWPALSAVACLAWLQALVWSPFPLPWLRLVATVGVMGSVIVAISGAHWMGAPEALIVVLLGLQLPLAFWVAVRGVRRARHGHRSERVGLARKERRPRGHARRRLRSTTRRAFRSPTAAQLWLEWRLHGLGLPFGVALALPVGVAFILLAGDNPRLDDSLFLNQPLSLLLLPMLFSFVAGGNYGAFSSRRSQSGSCSFLAVRPFDSVSFVLVKFKTVLRSLLICYGLVVPVVIALEFVTGRYRDVSPVADHLAGGESPVTLLAMGLGALALLTAGAWRFVADHLFIGLSGRKWVHTSAIIGGSVVFYGLAVLGWWLYRDPEWHAALQASVPWLLASLVALKFLLGAWALRELCRRKLLPISTIAKLTALWLAVVLALMALALWLVPRGKLPYSLVVCGAVLAVPLVRISLAPLALAWNRHR